MNVTKKMGDKNKQEGEWMPMAPRPIRPLLPPPVRPLPPRPLFQPPPPVSEEVAMEIVVEMEEEVPERPPATALPSGPPASSSSTVSLHCIQCVITAKFSYSMLGLSHIAKEYMLKNIQLLP